MSILLFHGGSHIIDVPEIREPERTLDFGKGFYTTTSFEQAERLVRNRIANKKWIHGYVNTYIFNVKQAEETLNVKKFDGASEEWIDFVLKNRIEEGFSHNYDIVIGPVADDNVYRQLALFEGGLLNKETLIKELMTYKLIDQYLFHTSSALRFLEYQTHQMI